MTYNPTRSTTISEHEKTQARMLLNPAATEILLNRVLASDSLWSPAGCELLDAKYQPAHHCIALYRYHGGYVTLMACFSPDSPFYHGGNALIDPRTGIRVYPFPNDPALPGLPRAADPVYMAHLLAPVLQKQFKGCRIVACRLEPVRYRPCQRCTFSVGVSIQFPDGKVTQQVLFAKVFDDPEELETVYQAMRQMTGSQHGPDGVAIPVPLARLQQERILVQREAKGGCLERLLTDTMNFNATMSRNLQSLISGSAQGIAAIHTMGIQVGRKRCLTDELEELSRWANAVGLICPSLSAQMGHLVSGLMAHSDIVASFATSAFTHGDFKPNQILVAGRQITFLDFDGCAMSDRAIDVATFLSTLRQIGVRQALDSAVPGAALGEMHALENNFLDHYCEAASTGDRFGQKVKWCQVLALLRKALRAFHRDPASPLAASIIREAHHFLSGLSE